MSRRQPFLNIRTEGALLPSDLLSRLLEGANIAGLKPEDYHLGAGEKLNEAISRSWTRLLPLWTAFQKSRKAIPSTDLGTTLTREKWLLQLFQELGYGRLIAASSFEIDGKTYPISHLWHGQHYQIPIHLVSFRAELDKRSEQRIQGASKASPHGLVQEFLNRSEPHLWAFLSNGLQLRILRDNASLTRQSHVEFDLEGIFESEAYADFRLLWMVCHQSRVEGTAKDRPETCWLEAWSKQAQTEGRRALDHLRDGVQKALEALGTGFIAHKANQSLRDRLQAGELRKEDFYRQLLRLAYRLIFLFVAEDRDLLHVPGTTEESRSRYARFYSGQRLRRMSERTRGGRHSDLWMGLRLVFAKLGDDTGCPELGLPALGGFLFASQALADLGGSELANEHLLLAIRQLGLVKDRSGWRLVDYRNLGSEELGSIYESLLELSPTMELDGGVFSLSVVSGSERKTTGSYYTPESLIQCLLDSALDPVLDDAAKKSNPVKAILNLKVCDPACGSGHFLIAAAHRIALRLASVKTGEEAPSPESIRSALRDVIGHCLFGVDLNPMAVELCKVSLWLEALDPGKPLSFLDGHIQCGNSLMGTTPALIAKGIPEAAFTTLVGDDSSTVSALKAQNKRELPKGGKRSSGQEGPTGLFSALGQRSAGSMAAVVAEMEALESALDGDIVAIHAKEFHYSAIRQSEAWRHAKIQADAWCAAFVWEKTQARLSGEIGSQPITQAAFEQLCESPDRVPPAMLEEVKRIANQYEFLHWHLAFPQVFKPNEGPHGWSGGFEVVLGNPPWERIKLQEKEWFATRLPAIASASNAAQRGLMIQSLEETHPSLFHAWMSALRIAAGESHIVRNGGFYPFCGRGDINTYAVFAEVMRNILSVSGYMGIVVPTSIAFADTTKFFFQDVVRRGVLKSLYSFFEIRQWFPDTDSRDPFCLMTISGPSISTAQGASLVFEAMSTEDLVDSNRRFTLDAEDIRNLNPNTGTCALFKNRQDAEVTKGIYRRIPVLIREATEDTPEENPYGVSFMTMFHMTNDSGLFRSKQILESEGFRLNGNCFVREEDVYLPLYEAKMLHLYNHRWGDFAMRDPSSRGNELPDISIDKLQDPNYQVMPNNWVSELEVKLRCADLPKHMIEIFRNGEMNVIALGLAYWAFGQWLHTEGMGTVPRAMAGLFDAWVNFNQIFTWAQGVAPTQLGICPDGPACFRPQAQHFVPAVPLKDLQYDVNTSPCWYEARKAPLERLLKVSEECPLTEEEWSGLQLAQDVQAAAHWILERRTPKWFLGWRNNGRTSDTRTMLSSLVPRCGIGNSFPLFSGVHNAKLASCFLANLCSFIGDYIVRQKAGGPNLNYFVISQIAIIEPSTYSQPHPWCSPISLIDWIVDRVLELTYTTWDLQPYAQDCGFSGLPFNWDEERRFQLRCELDAAFFHIYGLSRNEVVYVMETFTNVRRKDEERYGGCYRTKEAVLAAFDAMAEAIQSGQPYQTSLDPPPADPRCCHPSKGTHS